LVTSDLKFGFLFIFLFVFSAPCLFAGYLPDERLVILGGEKRQGQLPPQRQAEEPRPRQEQEYEQKKASNQMAEQQQQQEQQKDQQEVKVPERKIGQAQENSSSLRIPDFGPDGLKGLSPEQIKKLQAGEVVMTSSPEVTPDGHSVIAAAVMFKVAVEQAWEILSATDRQIEYLEEIKKLRVLEAGEDFNRTEFEVKVMGQKVRYTVVHHFLPELYYLWWELDKKAPHDLRDLSGFWRLYPVGEGKTIGRYGSRVVPGFPVPEFIRKPLFKNGVRSSLEKVKAYVEKNASSE